MSDIMRRLKKLEKRVADNPLHEGSAAKSPISGKRSAPRSGYVTWNSSRTALLLVMGIGLGVLGYLAGIRSNRGEGESRESTWREDQSALDHGLSQSSPVVNEGMGMEVAEASNTGSDLTTLVFEAEPILPSKTPGEPRHDSGWSGKRKGCVWSGQADAKDRYGRDGSR